MHLRNEAMHRVRVTHPAGLNGSEVFFAKTTNDNIFDRHSGFYHVIMPVSLWLSTSESACLEVYGLPLSGRGCRDPSQAQPGQIAELPLHLRPTRIPGQQGRDHPGRQAQQAVTA